MLSAARLLASLAAVLSLGTAHAQPLQEIPASFGSVSASSQSSQSRKAAMAFDGNSATRWEASNSSAGSWLAIRYPEVVNIQAVAFSEYGNRIRAGELQALSAQNVWSTVYSFTTPPVGTLSLPVRDAYGLRLLTTTKSNGQPSITELRIFGTRGALACVPGSTITGNVDCGGLTVSMPCSTHQPLFVLAPGASLANLKVAAGGSGDGILCQGNCTLNNIDWQGACSPAVRLAATPGARALILSNTYRSIAGQIQTPFVPNEGLRNGGIEVRYSKFHGTLASLIARPYLPTPNGRQNNHYTLINNTLYGSIAPLPSPINGKPQGALVNVHGMAGEAAHIHGMVIQGYQNGQPLVCNNWGPSAQGLLPLGEEWDSAACDVSLHDVSALPTP